MNPAASAQVKGWCPGALRPMLSGDGLIVRIRPFCGAFSLDQARGLADLARRLGNGHIDLTRRANLQLRGLSDEHMPELHAELGRLGLIDPDAETEATRNLMVAPLAGLDPAEALDVRPIARASPTVLPLTRVCSALPAKFGLLVDGGGAVSIAAERADVALLAVGAEIALGIDTPSGTQWLGVTSPDAAAAAALLAVRAFLEAAGDATRIRMRGLSAAGVAHVRVGSGADAAAVPGRAAEDGARSRSHRSRCRRGGALRSARSRTAARPGGAGRRSPAPRS